VVVAAAVAAAAAAAAEVAAVVAVVSQVPHCQLRQQPQVWAYGWRPMEGAAARASWQVSAVELMLLQVELMLPQVMLMLLQGFSLGCVLCFGPSLRLLVGVVIASRTCPGSHSSSCSATYIQGRTDNADRW